jgi:hypothetical protein
MLVVDHATLSDADLAALRDALEPITTLEDVVRWGLGASPSHDIVEVVTQDEFTHDVIVRWRDDAYLVFDAR